MKETFIKLLNKVCHKSGDDCASIEYFSDSSGTLNVYGEGVFEFGSDEDLYIKLMIYLAKDLHGK